MRSAFSLQLTKMTKMSNKHSVCKNLCVSRTAISVKDIFQSHETHSGKKLQLCTYRPNPYMHLKLEVLR